MKAKLAILITLVTVLSLALVGAGLAAGPDPEAQPGPGQGVLEIQTLDHEITVAYQGTGYNIHRFSRLRLAVNPGSNDFDYFCGNTKYFVGDVFVQAGQTTTVTLQPGECAEPVVSQPGPVDLLAIAYNDGFADGSSCGVYQKFYSDDPDIQDAYVQGYHDGLIAGNCPTDED